MVKENKSNDGKNGIKNYKSNMYFESNPEVGTILENLGSHYSELLEKYGEVYGAITESLNNGTDVIVTSQEALGNIKRGDGNKSIAVIEEPYEVKKPNSNYSLVKKGLSFVLQRPYEISPTLTVIEKRTKEIDLEDLVKEIKRGYSIAKDNVTTQTQRAENEFETAGPKIKELYGLERKIIESKGEYIIRTEDAALNLEKITKEIEEYVLDKKDKIGTTEYDLGLINLQEKRRDISREQAISTGLFDSCEVGLIHLRNLREAYELMLEKGLSPLIREGYKAQKSMEHALGQIDVTTSAHLSASGLSIVLAEAAKRHVTTSKDLSALTLMVSNMIERASSMSDAFYQPLIDPLALEASSKILSKIDGNQKRVVHNIERLKLVNSTNN